MMDVLGGLGATIYIEVVCMPQNERRWIWNIQERLDMDSDKPRRFAEAEAWNPRSRVARTKEPHQKAGSRDEL